MKSKEELEKEPMPYDNETPKKCPKCGNWFLSYPALSRRDNETYICPDCGVKEAMEDYMSSMKKEGLEEATTKALLEDPENKALTKPLTESVDWDYYDKFEDLINKYMPDQGEGETLASQIVTAVNKLVYKWYNDGDVFDNVNSGLQGWANDLSSYANWLYKYAPGDAPSILKNIYGMGEESDYETLLKELADNLLDENLLDSLEKSKQGSIYDCDGPFKFREYYEDDEDEWDDYEEDEDEEDEDDLEESKKLQEGVNNLTIRTGLTDKNAYDVLSSVIGQLSDGIWENSPGMSRYWQHMDIDQEGSEVVAKFDTQDYDSGFRGKDESQIKKWLANKVKQIVKEEGLDWNRDNTERVSYMHGSVTVQDAYRVYDKLLGRKDYIPDPDKKEESKEVKNVLGIEDGSDEEAKMTEIEGRNFKNEFDALSKEEQDKYKELIPVNQAGLSGDKSRALAKQYNLDAGILYWIANIGKFDLNESKEVMKKELNKDELLNKLEDYVLNQYTIFNDKLYDDFGDIQLNDKDNTKRSIYIYYDIEEDKISVTVGAAGARTFVDTLDEVAQFINAEIAKVNAQDEEIKKLTTESEDIDYDYILKQIEFLQKQDSHVLSIPDDFDVLEYVNIPEDDKYWTILDKILKDEEKSKGVYYSIEEVLEELHEYIESKIKPIEESLDGDNYEDMRSFTILILNNGSHYEDFNNYEDFCKALKRYFTEKETSIYNKLRTFDRSKINSEGYIKNDYQNMSTIAYPKEDLEEVKDLDIEHDEYLKKMDKKYKTFCKNMELDEKDPDDALFALDELEGQFGDEDGEYQELREFIHNELLESKKIEEDDKELEESKKVESEVNNDNNVIARMNKLLEIKEELIDFIKNTTCDTIKNNDIVKAAQNIERILNFQNWVEGQVEFLDRVYNSEESTASKRYNSREEYIDNDLQHNEYLMKELISLENMLIK